MISTPEALAVLVRVKVFYSEPPAEHRTSAQEAPPWTDNRGIGTALNKLMSTRFPSSPVQMELAAHLNKVSLLKASVQWAPRTATNEADALANGDSTGFDQSLECKIDPSTLKWCVLSQALQMGKQTENEHQEFLKSGRDPLRGQRRRKRKPDQRLKMKDPW